MASGQPAGAETLYALIDAARDPSLYPLVMEASGQACLFGGDVEEPLNRAAPYLVNLKAQEPLFRAWRTAGRGQAWGIMCRSGLPLDGLRRHFRHFLMAKLPDGTVAQFRFYDPRVFNPFLSSCTADELGPWFQGVSAYLAEDQATGAFHEFTLRDGQLHDDMAAAQ
jgi:Domain of unknown function (DUF4123)